MLENIGRVSEYVKNVTQSKLAEQKLFKTSEENSIADLLMPDNSPQAVTSRRISRLAGCVDRGGKVSYEDLAFLRKHAPTLYSRAMVATMERQAIEQRLRMCKSKQDVTSLKAEATINIASKAVGLGASPGMTAGELGGVSEQMGALNDTFDSFKRTQHYADLPDITETRAQRKARKKSGLTIVYINPWHS